MKTSANPKNGNEKKFQKSAWSHDGSSKFQKESTRQRVESSQPKNREDHIAGKGFTYLPHYNLVHKFIPMPQAMKVPDAEAAVDKEWKKLETTPAWQLDEVKRKKEEVILEAQRDKKKVHFDGHMSSQECGVGIKITEVQRQSRTPGDIVKRRLWTHAVFFELIPDDCCKSKITRL